MTSSSATRARFRPARAQATLVAVACLLAAPAGCRRDIDGLKPPERPQIIPPAPPPARPPMPGQPGYFPPGPPPVVGGSGGSEPVTGGAGGTGPTGSGGTGGNTPAVDAMQPGLPPSGPADSGASDFAAAEATPPPPPDAFPPEPVFGDTGPPGAQSPASNIVIYLPLDEGTGSGITEDASGNLSIGSLKGLDTRRAWVEGRFGSALRFPRGGAGAVRVSPAPSLNTIEMTWSLSVWVRLGGDMNGDGIIVSRRAQSAGGFIYAFGITSGLARLRLNSGNGYNLDMSIGQPVPKGPWVHLGVTFDKRTARIFVNGRPAAAQIYELGIPQEETPLYVGAGQISAAEMLGEHFAGDIDELVMYNRVLPNDEMASLAGGARPQVR
jgi:hypothetical protein